MVGSVQSDGQGSSATSLAAESTAVEARVKCAVRGPTAFSRKSFPLLLAATLST
jgi:hypothetical protein